MMTLPCVSQSKIQKSSGSKPQWLSKGEEAMNKKRTNISYRFVIVFDSDTNLKRMHERKLKMLGAKIESTNQIEGIEETRTENAQGVVHSTMKYIDKTTNQMKTKPFSHKLIDEYWTWDGLHYEYHTLYAVSESQEPQFDDFSFSSTYGAAPVVMSIIPGVGQLYKGSTVKGICLLGGTAALAVGALFCDNERADYKNKMKEQPQYAQTYNTKANNYETARNVCIGAAAAVWLYNIFDAALAKGKRRIVVKPANGSYISFNPIATPSSAGITLTYNF